MRSDAEAYAALRSDWRGRLLALDGLGPRVSADGTLVWVTIAEAPQESELILLGLIEGRPHFATIVEATAAPLFRSPAVWQALSVLSADDAAIFGTAHSLILWHNTHRYCPRCGGPTTLFRAGWGRKCERCGTEHFPRTDPVVIMLAEHDGRALVGRQGRFPPGNYSALAGFLEPGESVEEAVRREIMEEAGISIGAVRYIASQPWPFGGSQLMIGCIAEALDDTITLDAKELEDAIWVTRQEARVALSGADGRRFNTPPPFAIAHTLMTRWVDDDQ